jgi:hypothetical protein
MLPSPQMALKEQLNLLVNCFNRMEMEAFQ